MKKVSGDIILNLCNKKHDHMMYAYSGMEYDRQFFVILGHFFALLPHYWPQKLKLGKNKKTTRDIILLHMCRINQDHIMYGSWDIKCKWQSYCHFGSFSPDTIILHFCTTNNDHMMYGSWDSKHDRHNFLPFWAISCPFTP